MPKNVMEEGTDQFNTQEFGSGPFVLDEFKPSDHVNMSRYDDYYGEHEGMQEPLLDRWSGLVRPESSSRITAFQNQSVDALYEVPVSQYERVSNSQNVEMYSQPGGNLFEIVLHTGFEPFDDVRVRQAIKYALDLEEMLQSAQQGHGHIAQHNPISPAHKYYADLDNIFGPGAKIDKGKQLLAEAGYGDGVDLDFPLELVTDQADANQLSIIGTLAQQQLEKIGFRFEIKNITTSQYYDVFMTDEAKFITSWWDFRPLEESIYRLCLHSEGNWNQTHWKNKEFDRALEKSERSTDPAVKKKQLKKCQELAYRKGGFICPFFKDRIGAAQPYVKNTDPLLEATTQRSPSENVWLTDDAPEK
jgi:peptide/nickel transport system substrate-binding protein